MRGLKQLVANESQALTAKFKAQIFLRPIQRVTLAANLGAADLAVVPRPEGSLKDKVVLLRCYPASNLPAGARERENFLARVAAALPAFLGQVDAFAVPDQYQDRRFGVRAYHHPELLKKLNATDPVRLLGALVEPLVKAAPGQVLALTARDWYRKLAAQHGAKFTEAVQDVRELGRLFSELKSLQDWSGRVSNEGKVQYGDQGN